MDIETIGNIIATFGLAGLMFVMGLGLTRDDFGRIFAQPGAVSLGLFGQIVLLPLVAFLIASVFQLQPAIALGLMVIAACPGGPTSNAFSYMARGDVALSITLTAISSVLAFITVPTLINLSISQFGYGEGDVTLSFVDSAMRVFLMTALPVAMGMMLRSLNKQIADAIARRLFLLTFACVIVPSFGLVVREWKVFLDADLGGASAAILLNLSMMAIGFGLANLFKINTRQSRTISLEVGLQNFGLAFVIISVFRGDTELMLPGLVYLPCMLIMGFIAAYLFSRSGPALHADPQSIAAGTSQ